MQAHMHACTRRALASNSVQSEAGFSSHALVKRLTSLHSRARTHGAGRAPRSPGTATGGDRDATSSEDSFDRRPKPARRARSRTTTCAHSSMPSSPSSPTSPYGSDQEACGAGGDGDKSNSVSSSWGHKQQRGSEGGGVGGDGAQGGASSGETPCATPTASNTNRPSSSLHAPPTLATSPTLSHYVRAPSGTLENVSLSSDSATSLARTTRKGSRTASPVAAAAHHLQHQQPHHHQLQQPLFASRSSHYNDKGQARWGSAHALSPFQQPPAIELANTRATVHAPTMRTLAERVKERSPSMPALAIAPATPHGPAPHHHPSDSYATATSNNSHSDQLPLRSSSYAQPPQQRLQGWGSSPQLPTGSSHSTLIPRGSSSNQALHPNLRAASEQALHGGGSLTDSAPPLQPHRPRTGLRVQLHEPSDQLAPSMSDQLRSSLPRSLPHTPHTPQGDFTSAENTSGWVTGSEGLSLGSPSPASRGHAARMRAVGFAEPASWDGEGQESARGGHGAPAHARAQPGRDANDGG